MAAVTIKFDKCQEEHQLHIEITVVLPPQMILDGLVVGVCNSARTHIAVSVTAVSFIFGQDKESHLFHSGF